MVIIEKKGDQHVKSLVISKPYSIYNYYSFIDLDSVKIVSTALISSWDLAFDASPKGWKVLINGAISLEVAKTGSNNFSENFSTYNLPSWQFDASSGNEDSTAIGRWFTEENAEYNYTNQVYLLGKNNGDGTYQVLKKLSFIKLSDENVMFIAGLPDASIPDTFQINKNPDYRYVYFSFSTPEQTLFIEPLKESWDIVAGTYKTILYTNTGVPTPYPVRGVLSNYPLIAVKKILKADFFSAGLSDTVGMAFDYRQDAIGYDWKDYFGTEIYQIVPNVYYFLKTKSGKLVKFEFTGYTSANAEYGYPSLRLVNLD